MAVQWDMIVREALQSRPQPELPRRLKLPVLPQAVIAFNQIADDPDTSPQKLAATIETDAVLTSELLKQINSVAMGLRQQVSSVVQSICLLGARRTKTLVLTAALQSTSKNCASRLIHTLQFQRENLTRGLFARETARVMGIDGENAYLGGLLQDFLLPALTEGFYEDYVGIQRRNGELVELEREVFGWDHASVAAHLLHEWGLPDELVGCVLLHHDLERILVDARLQTTSLVAAAAAACLPDSLKQSPTGFDKLLVLQDVLSDFEPMQIALTVDDEFADRQQKSDLLDQLNHVAEISLHQRQTDLVSHDRKIGNYTLEEQIGEGGMGVVYKATHCLLKRPGAIKLLHSAKVSAESLARFESEVLLTCGLTSPHTVAVYDYGVTPAGLFYYVMEYLEGLTLAQLIKRNGPQPASRVIHFLRQVCLSLTEAHAHGLIHRDLKPENLMICERGGISDTLKVLDFGLARAISDKVETNSTSLSGTPRYMPPEAILAGQPLDERSDLYSLGAVGYFLLTGQPVFTDKDLKSLLKAQISSIPDRPSVRLNSPVDRDLEELILTCLKKSRNERPASASELYRLLGQCQSARLVDHTGLTSPDLPATDLLVAMN